MKSPHGWILILGALVVVIVAWHAVEGQGPWASRETRHLRAMKDRTSPPAVVHDINLADIARLPRRRPMAEYEPIEQRGVRMEGCMQKIEQAGDGDFHLEVVRSPRGASAHDTSYVTAEITPIWYRGTHWTYERLAAAFGLEGARAARTGHLQRVRLSGWLLDDVWVDRLAGRSSPKNGASRISAWEIHPVTRIELWDDSLGRFVDLPR